MVTQRLQDALMRQVNEEIWTANLYLSMSLDASYLGYKGISHWFRKQYEEELQHCFKIISYLESNFVKIKLLPVAAVQTDWESPLKMFEEALVQERKVSVTFHKLYEMSLEDKDYATNIFLQWFVTEQVEEEENLQNLIDELKVLSDNKAAVLMFDQKLESR